MSVTCANSVACALTKIWNGDRRIVIRLLVGAKETLPFSRASRPVLGLTQPPCAVDSNGFSAGYSSRDVNLTTQPHLQVTVRYIHAVKWFISFTEYYPIWPQVLHH